jgi:hypothetical protein
MGDYGKVMDNNRYVHWQERNCCSAIASAAAFCVKLGDETSRWEALLVKQHAV